MEKSIDKTLEKINPKRRLFVKTLLHAAYIVPTIVSVSMVDQRLDLSTAHAQSGNVTLG
jgi:prolyl-tRNA editing enzyme YbaK/EbsC (Cys-tRNA(Pro) deacylase)